ncbi:hypothetical protein [Polaribacter sp. P097]|uniref:hypothetical protein n=1 Tax=Polaribacter sp. P097 TaxID=3117398 RepID=UPI002FE0EBE3
MNNKILILLQILTIGFLTSCDTEVKEKTTYFGGKIINPKSNKVILYSMEQVIDTFLLDENQKFIGELKEANEGLYYFVHGNENQYIYIEPTDSLMLRLNTWDFDETLVFAGKGAERNNILIDCFLEDEKEKKNFYKLNKQQPEVFKKVTDSLLAIKLVTYNDYILEHPNETEGFNEVLKVALTFPIYSRFERYPIIYSKYAEDGSFPEVDATFYDYRKNIDINKDTMMYFPPYSRYIRNYLYNETYAQGHKPMRNKYTPDFTLDLLNIIDDRIKSQNTKNAFLKQTLVSHFYNKSSDQINLEAFDLFLKSSTNEKDKTQIQSLLNDSKVITLGNELPNFEITDYTNADHSIHKLIKNKNSFLLFWNPEYVSKSYLSSRVIYLSEKFPEINFHVIKTDGKDEDKIEKLDIKNQFYINKDNLAQTFLSSKMTRTILVDHNGKVVNGYASLYSNNLIPYLENLNKK